MKNKLFILCIFLMSITLVNAQSITVKGTVTDQNMVPLPGVTILEKNTTNGVATDFDGNFTLKVSSNGAILNISSLGFTTQEITIGNETTLNITLVEDASTLDEVVVVGYGTMKKSDLTGAVSQISTKTLEIEKPNDLSDLLRGNIAGLAVGFSTSAKGTSDFQIRGETTLAAGGSPLIVLDGTIYNGDISDINPVDIESVSVLKDASSAAVYGARATNGVIMVTTKKGKSGKPTVNFTANTGMATMSVDQPVYSPHGFVDWRRDVARSTNVQKVNDTPLIYDNPLTLPSGTSVEEWLAYDGSSGNPTEVWLNRLNLQPVEIDNYNQGKSVDWYDMTFQHGLRQDYTVSLSGKNEGVKYYWSIGYTDNEGIRVGDEFTTIRSRLNLEAKVNDWLTVGMNSQFSDRDQSSVPVDYSFTNNSPWGSEYEDDGFTLRLSPQDDSGAGAIHPLLARTFTERERKYNTLNANLFAKVQLPFGIEYQVNFTNRYNFYNYRNHRSSEHPSWGAFGGDAVREDSKTYEWQIDNILRYNKVIADDHKVNVTLLANAEKKQYWSDHMTNKGFQPSDVLGFHNMNAGSTPIISSDDTYQTANAYMARLLYTYKDKYLFTGSVRRDGYSAFGVNNKQATFPSMAFGWVLTEENFLNAVNGLNFLKLRYSYGENGNRNIGAYAALATLQSGKYLLVNQGGSVYQTTQLYVNKLQNDDLKWERTNSHNIGVDFGVWDNRIRGSAEVYSSTTEDLLVRRALPDITGFTSITTNLGEISNKGFELTLDTRNMTRENFTWNSSIAFSTNRNEIVSLYGNMEDVLDENGNVIGQKESSDLGNGWHIGQPIDVDWGLTTNGVYTTDEVAEAAEFGVQPGDYRVVDTNDDGIYTNDDKTFHGQRSPKYRWTLRNEFNFHKDWTFSFMMYSYGGHQGTYNQAKNQGFGNRTSSYVTPYWTEENQSNEYARLFSNNGSASFNVYRDKTFIRLQNISLGYTLPRNITQKANISSLRLSANVKNAAVWTKEWDFWDPENSGPTPRTFTLGLNITL